VDCQKDNIPVKPQFTGFLYLCFHLSGPQVGERRDIGAKKLHYLSPNVHFYAF
jgi:hypothetical protein